MRDSKYNGYNKYIVVILISAEDQLFGLDDDIDSLLDDIKGRF